MHSVKVVMHADQLIKVAGKLVNVHHIKAIVVSDDVIIEVILKEDNSTIAGLRDEKE